MWIALAATCHLFRDKMYLQTGRYMFSMITSFSLKPLHLTPSIHHDMNFLHLYKIILNCYYKNMSHNSPRWNDNRHYSFNKHDNRYGHCWPSFPKTLSYSYETLSVGEGWNWEVTHCQSNLHQLLQLVCTHYSSTKRWWRKTIGNRL